MRRDAMTKDIRLRVGFHRHPKIRKLRNALGADAMVSLLTLWGFASEHRQTGILTGMDSEDIALAAEWDGDPAKFTSTLVSVGLLDQSQEEFAIHGWAEHQPWAYHAPARSEMARKAAAIRWGSDANRMRTICETHTEGNAPSPSPNPSPKPRSTSIAKARGNNPPSPPPAESEGVYFLRVDDFFKAMGSGNLDEWRKAYPAIRIEDELHRARAWLKGNPEKRKKNLRRFIVGWLARAQEKGGTGGRRPQEIVGEHRADGNGAQSKYDGIGTFIRSR